MVSVKRYDEIDRGYLLAEERFKALASRHRIKILEYLQDGEKSLQDIIKHLEPLAEKTISGHMSKLYRCGMVKSRRFSKEAKYYITDKSVLAVMKGFYRPMD